MQLVDSLLRSSDLQSIQVSSSTIPETRHLNDKEMKRQLSYLLILSLNHEHVADDYLRKALHAFILQFADLPLK